MLFPALAGCAGPTEEDVSLAACGATWFDEAPQDPVPFEQAQAVAPDVMAALAEPRGDGVRVASADCTEAAPEQWTDLAALRCPPWDRHDRLVARCSVGVSDAPWGDGTLLLDLTDPASTARPSSRP